MTTDARPPSDPHAAMQPHRGLRLGKYELIRPLGTGGMAQVWLAHKPILGGATKVCALKMPTDLLGADERLRDGLLNEIRIASMLSHSNIVQVFDAGILHGILYMELERIDGMDLAVLLESMRERQTEMSIEMAVYIIRAILEGLNYAHTFAIDGSGQGIHHRDLSPSNVLISSAGEVKIMDFGIAKSDHDVTSGHHIKGKLRYMAPEQALGKTSAKVDLFAAGAVFFEMLEGRGFRERGPQMEMMAAAIHQPAPALVREDVPAVLRSFYEKLVAQDPAARTANAAEALSNLSLWRGNDIHAHEMRAFYLRQLDRGRHSGLTMASINVPESFRRLVAALEVSTAASDTREKDNVALQLEQREALADVRASARAAPPVPEHRPYESEPDAPQIMRRSSGLGAARAPVAVPIAGSPASTEDALPLHLRQGAAAAAASPAPTLCLDPASDRGPTPTRTDRLHPFPLASDSIPSPARPPSPPDSPAPPRTSFESRPATTPDIRNTGDDTDLGFPSPGVSEHGGARSQTVWLVAASAVVLVLSILTTTWLLSASRDDAITTAPSVREDAAPPPADVEAEREPARGPTLMPIKPVAEPVAGEAVVGAPSSVIVTAPAAVAATETQEISPAVAPATDPIPAVASEDPPAKPAPPTRKPKPAPVGVRLSPNFVDGEIRIGKRTWVVKHTFDVTIAAGRYAVSWRELGADTWQAVPEVVLDPAFEYLVRVGPKSVTFGKSPRKAGGP